MRSWLPSRGGWSLHKRLQARVFVLTFLAYTCFHMTRKPQSIIKSVMHPVSATGRSTYDPVLNPGWAPFNRDVVPEEVSTVGLRLSNAKPGANGLYSCPEAPVRLCPVYVKDGDERYVMRRSPQDLALAVAVAVGDKGKDSGRVFGACNWTIFEDSAPLYVQHYCGEFPAHASEEVADGIFWFKVSTGKVDKKVHTVPATTDGKILLGELDTAFLAVYTVGLFISGYVADKVDLRYFLSIGMFGSGLALICMAAAYLFNIHSLGYFILLNVLAGGFQSMGWPSVVAIMASWFGEGRRGLIMGVWNAHTSIGNILGSVITAASISEGLHSEDWPLGFAVPGTIICLMSFVVFALIVPRPEESVPDADVELLEPLVDTVEEEQEESSKECFTSFVSSFRQALMIPGLIPFALCLGFSKMCAYALLYWGAYFLGHCGFSSTRAGYLCSFFDVGGIFGGISAGYLSDRTGCHGVVAFSYLVVSIPVLWIYYKCAISLVVDDGGEPPVLPHILLMMLVGFWINAPYALVTTAVSADLGTRPELKNADGSHRILALVTGIIDGTGSIGAMLQGIVVGLLSTSSWKSVFTFLMVAELIAALMIVPIVYREAKTVFFGQSRREAFDEAESF